MINVIDNLPMFEKTFEVKNTIKKYKKSLPYTMQKFVGDFSLTSKDSKFQPIWNSYVKGVSSQVYLVRTPTPNAYTIPGFTNSPRNMVLLSLLPDSVAHAFITLMSAKQATLNITGEPGKNGTAIIHAPKNMKFNYWHTKGLKQILKDEELVATGLHELGHWRHGLPSFFTILFHKLKYVAIIVGGLLGQIKHIIVWSITIALFMAALLINRTTEYKADSFAKECGFGRELSSALTKIAYLKRTNISVAGQLDDLITRTITRIQNVIEKFFPILGHPSHNKRTAALKESELLIYENVVIDQLSNMLKIVFEPLDEFFRKHESLLYPYGIK